VQGGASPSLYLAVHEAVPASPAAFLLAVGRAYLVEPSQAAFRAVQEAPEAAYLEGSSQEVPSREAVLVAVCLAVVHGLETFQEEVHGVEVLPTAGPCQAEPCREEPSLAAALAEEASLEEDL
jgi:hypothetical protein